MPSVTALPAGSRIGIDGVDCSGKTTLAEALAERLPHVVRASVDSFHRPRAERYARGRDSADGCYRDTFDLEKLRTRLLEPFACGDKILTSAFDQLSDSPYEISLRPAPDAVLVVDGVFLLRPELAGCFELVVHLVLDDESVIRRALRRDPDIPERLYRQRYLPAQRLYEAEAFPRERADVVIEVG